MVDCMFGSAPYCVIFDFNVEMRKEYPVISFHFCIVAFRLHAMARALWPLWTRHDSLDI
jgi:hypothetical protein